jgi:uncharacterized protein YerC
LNFGNDTYEMVLERIKTEETTEEK